METPIMIVLQADGKQGGTLGQALDAFQIMPWWKRSDLIAQMIRTCRNMPTVQDFLLAHDALKGSDAIAKRCAIVDYCSKHYGLNLTPSDGRHDAEDEKGRRVVIVGSWIHGLGYLLRGIVRERTKGKPFTWLGNGQASTGAVQVVHIGERDTVPQDYAA